MERKIGNTTIPAVGFGMMGLSAYYGRVESDEERFKVLDAAIAHGCTHWDTANVYGDSEELIGKWFKRTGKRSSIFLATKFGYQEDESGRGDPGYVKEQFATSLERLGVDYVDLLYQHRPDAKVPIEVTVRTITEFVKEGKVKYIGLSHCTANDLRRAHAIHPISAIQIEYSPFVRYIEDERIGLLSTARELGVKVVAYSPLGNGIITGRYKTPEDFDTEDDVRTIMDKYSADNLPKFLQIVEKLKTIGEAYGITPAQVALAWILAQGDDILVIPGTKRVQFLEQNIAAGNVKLSDEDVTTVRRVIEENEAPGSKFSDEELTNILPATPELGMYAILYSEGFAVRPS